MNLVTLSGCKGRLGQAKFQFSLFSMAGTADMMKVDPLELSDIDAGIWTLYWINKLYPGITWGEILQAKQTQMAGWLGDRFRDVGSFLGRGISDAGDKIGDWGGDAIRLVTDREVMEGVSQYSAAYATGGASEGIRGFLGQLGNIVPDSWKKDLLGTLGRDAKAAAAPQLITGVDNKVLLIGGGLLVVLLIMTR